ncbi:ATP synthase F0 subunit B [Desulfatirhabdium butyrativorans]|uniref:ATP synthase F0 subunit B n=1 Tax=Desulfatirhabdium butyrativorans TaxID=340467 RepID=UPI00041485CD|nr:ATP synthase F0 subunit B [Desulfatirhabdium butyrativorans]
MKCQKLRAGTKTVLMLVLAAMVFCLPIVAVASGGGEGQGEHGSGATPGWVATDTYRVMNFVVLAGALIFLLRKPLAQALDSRIKGIRVQLEDLEAKKSAAEKELAKYESQIAELSKESDKIISEYIRQGNDAKAKILKEAEAAAIKLEEQAKRNIEHEFQQAKEKLQAEIIEKALEKAEGRIKSKITAEDQNLLIDEYLQKVVA